ncbi:hypothetical protein JOD15_003289 [Enterococcus ureilyticus]|nr:hypothetical protein [Enterococcus ureilyticus]
MKKKFVVLAAIAIPIVVKQYRKHSRVYQSSLKS